MTFCSVAASAQNLDPTVEVNRSYEGKLMEVHKPMLEMAVPDSVLRFDLDFDYEVFDNPYKGAYEFKPYTMELQPVGKAAEQKRLYMRLGAGNGLEALSLHPSADFVWSPFLREKFKMDVYARHRSYVGEYRKVDAPDLSQKDVNLKMKSSYGRADYDFLTQAGLDARYDWADGTVRLDAGYYGIAERYGSQSNMYNALDVRAGVASKDYGQFINYDVYASYRFGIDRYEYKNLVVFVEIFDGKEGTLLTADTLCCSIYDDDGRREGSTAGALYQVGSDEVFIGNFGCDTVLMRLSHLMESDELCGVSDVGIRLCSSSARGQHQF